MVIIPFCYLCLIFQLCTIILKLGRWEVDGLVRTLGLILGGVGVGLIGAWTLSSLHPASRPGASAASRPIHGRFSSPMPSLPTFPSSSSPPSASQSPSSSVAPSVSSSVTASGVQWVNVPLMLDGTAFGSASLPSSWNATPRVIDGGGSGATLVWSSPSGANSLNVQVSSAYGSNHNVLNGGNAFDPALALPQSGCSISANEGAVYPFTCSGFQGFVDTNPAVSGAVTVWTVGPNGSELSYILNSVQLSSSALASEGQ